MTTEEIIQRLLDEKKITVKEAMQMIKDLLKNEIYIPIVKPETKPFNPNQVVAMYGVITNPYVYNTDGESTSTSSNTIYG